MIPFVFVSQLYKYIGNYMDEDISYFNFEDHLSLVTGR